MRKLVAYLAHPVSAPTLHEINRNLDNARGWLHFLVDATPWAISAPWIPYVETLAESAYRERGIADDLEMVRRCDLVVLTGGRISHGMEQERWAAIEADIPVCDLTPFGTSAPSLRPRDLLLRLSIGNALESMKALFEKRDALEATRRG